MYEFSLNSSDFHVCMASDRCATLFSTLNLVRFGLKNVCPLFSPVGVELTTGGYRIFPQGQILFKVMSDYTGCSLTHGTIFDSLSKNASLSRYRIIKYLKILGKFFTF